MMVLGERIEGVIAGYGYIRGTVVGRTYEEHERIDILTDSGQVIADVRIAQLRAA